MQPISYHPVSMESQEIDLFSITRQNQKLRRYILALSISLAIVTTSSVLYSFASPSSTSCDTYNTLQENSGTQPIANQHTNTATTTTSTSSTSDPAYENLVHWLLKGGASIDGVEGRSAFAGGGRGLFATRDLSRHEHVFSIPAQLWLSETNAKTMSPIARLFHKDPIVKKFDAIDGDAWALVLLLEYERYNPYSFWKPYTDFIPQPASVIRWTDEELATLQSATLTEKAVHYRNYITDTYHELMLHLIRHYPHMFSTATNTLASFMASTVTSWTRSFDVSRDGSKRKESGLVPLGDLLNHVAGTPFDHWWMETNGKDSCGVEVASSFEFKTPESKRTGQEVVISYSDVRASFSWVLWAGFVPQETKYGDYLTLRVRRRMGMGVDGGNLCSVCVCSDVMCYCDVSG
eukprot:c8249_g1_i1.p1 GENE.c8249_g1_i1~~c8249_g1_i1.p1  ORF type:complete len:406 (-),score=87.69 c8249_g1_i1:585-1802(-)